MPKYHRFNRKCSNPSRHLNLSIIGAYVWQLLKVDLNLHICKYTYKVQITQQLNPLDNFRSWSSFVSWIASTICHHNWSERKTVESKKKSMYGAGYGLVASLACNFLNIRLKRRLEWIESVTVTCWPVIFSKFESIGSRRSLVLTGWCYAQFEDCVWVWKCRRVSIPTA